MSVSEDKVPGEEVGRLKAKDPDLGDNGLVNYRIIDGDGVGMFELTTDSETREAVIKLKKVRRERYFLTETNPPLALLWVFTSPFGKYLKIFVFLLPSS